MNHERFITICNMLRGVSCFTYILVLGQVAYILYHYFHVIRMEKEMGIPKVGLLPLHVVTLGTMLLVSEGACVGQNIQHLNHDPNYFVWVNPPMLLFTMWGLSLVMKFEYLRYKYAKRDDSTTMVPLIEQ